MTLTLTTKAGKPAKYANLRLGTDVTPFEIVKVVSDKTIEIREMGTKELPWERDFHLGGFFGHEANNHEQKWKCFPNEEYAVIRARKNKGGYWKSAYGKHYLAANPIKHYDYNF